MDACPTEQALVDHIEAGLESARSGGVEAHLRGCPACLELVAELARLAHPAQEPTRAVEEAAGLPPRYQVTGILGEGAMGRVYAAHDRELSRDVAIKVIRPDRASPELAARLVRESRLMARLQHPAVVSVYDVVSSPERVFVVMELIRGTTLRGWASEARRTWREVLEVIGQVADGLAAAHAAGLIHRDIKPDNILVAIRAGAIGRVALGDFGVARAHDPEPPLGTSRLGPAAIAPSTLAGTPAYMAPEQLADGVSDERSDVFALAATCWELLYGRRAYPGTTIEAIYAAVAEGPPRPAPPGPAGVRDGVPAWLGRALIAALLPAREQRTPTVAAFRHTIDVARRDRRRRRAAATLGALAAIGATAFGVSQRARPELCAEAGELVDQVWSKDRADRLVQGFAALPTDFARGAGPALVAEVDRWRHAWRLARTAACTSEPTERTRRERCLDRALGGLTAALDVWSRPDLPLAIELSKGAVLPSVAACATPPARAEPIPAALAPVVREVDRMFALENAGHHAEAVAIHLAQGPAIARATDASFLAAAGFADALVAGADGKLAEADAALARAQAAAAQIGDPRGVARTLAARASFAVDAGEPARAAALYQSAVAVAALAGTPTDADEVFVITALKLARADHTLEQDPDRARASLAGLRARGDRRADWSVSRGLLMVAEAEAMVETPAALASARTHAEEARAIAVAALGADHPQLGFVEFTLASLDTDEGHVDLALTRYDHAIAILTAAYGPSHLVVVKTQLKRAFALADDGRTDQARDALIAVEPTLIAVEGAGHQDVAMLRRARGSLEIDQHHPAAAIAPLTAAIATYTRRGDPGPDLGRAYELLGIAHRDLGHQAESLAAFAHAEAAYPDDAADEHARVRALIEEAGGR